MFFQVGGAAGGSLDIEPHFIESPDQRQPFLLILVRQGNHDGPVVLQFHAGGRHRLEHGTVKRLVEADRFSGGFHFRRQVGVHSQEL